MVAAYGWGVDGLRARYTFPGSASADLPADSTLAYLYDPSGNVAERMELLYNSDPAQTDGLYVQVRDYQVFDAYGALSGRIDTISYPSIPMDLDPVGFGGQYGYYTDVETGLCLLGARYYDPSVGRFLNRDPTGYGGGINLYGFCGNNPVNESDPSGTDFTIGSRNRPLLVFTAADAQQGLKVGSAATGSSFTFGLYNGGKYRNDPSFGTSLALANFGRDTLIGVASGGASRYAYILKADALVSKVLEGKSVEELLSQVSGKNVLLKSIWGTGAKEAGQALEAASSLRSYKLPTGLTREDLLAYRQLLQKQVLKRGLQGVRSINDLPKNDVQYLRVKLIDTVLRKSILN